MSVERPFVPEGAVAKGPEHASVDQTSTPCVLFVPAYNEASRILRCLDSMVNQQLPAGCVWREWVVFAGGSTDGTAQLVANWAAHHDRSSAPPVSVNADLTCWSKADKLATCHAELVAAGVVARPWSLSMRTLRLYREPSRSYCNHFPAIQSWPSFGEPTSSTTAPGVAEARPSSLRPAIVRRGSGVIGRLGRTAGFSHTGCSRSLSSRGRQEWLLRIPSYRLSRWRTTCRLYPRSTHKSSSRSRAATRTSTCGPIGATAHSMWRGGRRPGLKAGSRLQRQTCGRLGLPRRPTQSGRVATRSLER